MAVAKNNRAKEQYQKEILDKIRKEKPKRLNALYEKQNIKHIELPYINKKKNFGDFILENIDTVEKKAKSIEQLVPNYDLLSEKIKEFKEILKGRTSENSGDKQINEKRSDKKQKAKELTQYFEALMLLIACKKNKNISYINNLRWREIEGMNKALYVNLCDDVIVKHDDDFKNFWLRLIDEYENKDTIKKLLKVGVDAIIFHSIEMKGKISIYWIKSF